MVQTVRTNYQWPMALEPMPSCVESTREFNVSFGARIYIGANAMDSKKRRRPIGVEKSGVRCGNLPPMTFKYSSGRTPMSLRRTDVSMS